MQDEHLTAETVADHLEGLLGPGEAAEAERHLARCPECSAVRADLGRVRAALASDSAAPMPASVAARIDVALAEVAEARAAAELSAAGTDRADQGQSAQQLARSRAGGWPGDRWAGSVPRRRRWPALGGALATIAIVVAALVVLPRLSTSQDEGTQVATAREGGAPAAGSGAESSSPGPNPTANGSDLATGSGLSAGGARVVRSGRAYTAYTLSAGVRELLAEQDTTRIAVAGPPQAASPGASGSQRQSSDSLAFAQFAGGSTALTACIQGLVKSDVVPIVVDLATYGAKPAAIIVLPDPADPTSANVYVVPPDCGRGESTPIATTTVRRPVTATPSPNSGTPSTTAPPP